MTRRLLPLAFVLAGCATTGTTSLRVQGAPPDASVTIDDEYLGSFAHVAKRGVALPPGKHRITVEKAGYFAWDKLVEANGDLVRIDVRMTKIPN